MWPNPLETADLVTFTEEILNGKHQFLCSVNNLKFFFTCFSEKLKSYLSNFCTKIKNALAGHLQPLSRYNKKQMLNISKPSDVYSEPSQTSYMESFAKIFNHCAAIYELYSCAIIVLSIIIIYLFWYVFVGFPAPKPQNFSLENKSVLAQGWEPWDTCFLHPSWA